MMVNYFVIPAYKPNYNYFCEINEILTFFFWFGLVSLFNGISTFVSYLMPKPFS